MRRLRTIRTAAGARTGTAVAGVALGLLLATALVPAAVGAGSPPAAEELRAQRAKLGSATDSATVELYALESELARARARAAELGRRRSALAEEQEAARARLAVAARAARESQRQLHALVRQLYAEGSADPVAVVLGAASLDEALSALESLDRTAAAQLVVSERARASRVRLERRNAELAARGRELARVSAEAEEQARALERRVSARARFVAELRSRLELTSRELATVEAQARAAGERAATLQQSTAAEAKPSPAAPRSADAFAAAAGPRTLRVEAVAYTIHGRTATGIPTAYGVVAVDPAVIPLGSRLYVPGYGDAVAADTGSAVRGAMIDLWFPTAEEAALWGRRSVTITIR